MSEEMYLAEICDYLEYELQTISSVRTIRSLEFLLSKLPERVLYIVSSMSPKLKIPLSSHDEESNREILEKLNQMQRDYYLGVSIKLEKLKESYNYEEIFWDSLRNKLDELSDYFKRIEREKRK